MLQEIRSSLSLFTFLTLLTGVAYPLFTTFVGQSLFPHQANGSLVKEGEKIIGSELIGQQFFSDRYFHPRPSAAGNGYDAAASSGSNLAPSSKKLMQASVARVNELRKTSETRPIPIDLITSSGSGLDPDISVAAAQYQATRIALTRNLPLLQIEKLISSNTTHRTFGFLGEERVNVFAINRALNFMLPVSNTPLTNP
jgi:potassium-transporting ATPase KdpC subunit